MYDFEAYGDKNQRKEPTETLIIENKHVPASVSVVDTLEREPTHICERDPAVLVKKFMEELERREENIREQVRAAFKPDDINMLTKTQRLKIEEWCNQVPVLGFNSGKYDLNLIRKHFAELVADTTDKVKVAKNGNKIMYILTKNSRFLDIINYLGPGTSYEKWVKAYECESEKSEVFKLLGNSGYGKLIEALERQTNTIYTKKEKIVDQALRSAFFSDLDEIGQAYELESRKPRITIRRPSFQVGIAVYQLAKLRMLEFYYDFLDRYFDRKDFELIQMDTDSNYMAISAEKLEDIVKPDLKEEFEVKKKNWLAWDKWSSRTPGLFKLEFQGRRMIALSSKCYFGEEHDCKKNKLSTKGVSKIQNDLTWQRFKKALEGNKDIATNRGFRMRDGQIVTYEQQKLGLSAYYDKRWVLEDGIHTEPIEFHC